MGSLPNLHELEEVERRREKRREHERELLQLKRAHESGKERERMAMFIQRKPSSYNTYLMAGLGIGGGGSLGMAAAAGALHMTNNAPSVAAIATGGGAGIGTAAVAAAAATAGVAATANTLSGIAVGGATLFGMGNHTLHHQHHQHRHSWTARRVLRTRSSGTAHHLWDEQMLEHLAAYSPVSTRSHRINPVSSYQLQAALIASRRRESVNSSIGANSIRRLITLNNRNCRHKVPIHVRRKVCKSFTFLNLAHLLLSAILLPIFGLQASNSVWHHREHWVHVGPNIGSFLLSGTFLITAGMCLVTIRLMRKFGFGLILGANYTTVCFFLLCHLYPSVFTLLPAYILLGLTLGPAWISKIAVIVHFGSKISCSQHECSFSSAHAADSLDEHKMFCNRDKRVRRLSRSLQAAQDIGLVLGALLASLTLACTASDWNCLSFNDMSGVISMPQLERINDSQVSSNSRAFPYTMSYFWPRIAGYFDDFYNLNDHNERICGAGMCPMWFIDYDNLFPTLADLNETIYTQFINGKERAGGVTLICAYLFLSILALLCTICMGKIQSTFRHDTFKTLTDTVLFAGPMAFFIGTEQAYMLGDFLRAFVSCSLGISMVAGALIGMGVMQFIISTTLSMLLRHVKRIVVILAGFFFHSCLLLALYSWKPSSDDSALFYVLAASWGACNGMWETLLMNLVILNHTNHAADAAAPLQALRFLAMGITFAAHGFICETHKIIIMCILLVICLPPYAMLELRLEAQRKAQLNHL